MLVICEVCDNNVIDELSARRGETVCVLCKKEIMRKEREEKKKNRKKVCKICGFEGPLDTFRKYSLTCKKCCAAQARERRSAHPESTKNYKRDPKATKKYNHKYYLEHREESLERTQRNRAKKKQCT
jgi:predicted RNA-binding Zn-ribbon protein involved in translation (DUF1610 family)